MLGGRKPQYRITENRCNLIQRTTMQSKCCRNSTQQWTRHRTKKLLSKLMTSEDRFEQLTPRTTPKHLGPAGKASKSHMRRGPISKRIRRIGILFVLCAVVPTSWAQSGHSRSSRNGVSPIFKSKPPVDLRGE